ncbi:hypothetical protein [Erwinia aphidicola]|uniref:Uncharacterized protein n=1 Tax=Erwinia aphidicola TaxID=68334 RepID=A0ABU8DKF6_ERWAP
MKVLSAPQKLCIYSDDSRYQTLVFLKDIDNEGILRKNKIEIHLDKVQFASAAASLLFFAIVNRAQLLTKDPNLFKFRWPKKDTNPEGHRWVVQTGLSIALLAGTEEKMSSLVAEGRFFQTAVEPYSHLASTVQVLQLKASLNDEQHSLLEIAIGEALLNVSHHAYESSIFSRDLSLMKGKRWWQCAWFSEEENTVVFIICDLGSGIFHTFSPNDNGNSYEKQVSSVSKAMLVGESRFEGSGRGNGSEDIKRPIGTGCGDSETLLILTGNVRYSYNSNQLQPLCEKISEYIPGTLLEWTLTPRR